MKEIIGKVLGVLSGGITDRALDIIEKQFPGKLGPQEKAQLTLELKNLDHERELAAERAGQEAMEALNRRIADYEGTAKEIKDMWLIGPVIILLRSMFRPVASYATIWMDFSYFTKDGAGWPEGSAGLLLAINLIVLGFWFGERTIKNLMPLFLAWLDKRQPPS